MTLTRMYGGYRGEDMTQGVIIERTADELILTLDNGAGNPVTGAMVQQGRTLAVGVWPWGMETSQRRLTGRASQKLRMARGLGRRAHGPQKGHCRAPRARRQ